MPKMVALIREFRYGGKTVRSGETFDVRDRDVKVLRALGHAKDAPEVPKTQKPPEPRKVETQALKAETEGENPSEVRLRRTYRRRDLTSEE
jgi:hypothetical protein